MTSDHIDAGLDVFIRVCVGALAGAFQGIRGLALALLRSRWPLPRWARALTWGSFLSACLLAYAVWQDGVGELATLLGAGGGTTVVALLLIVPAFAISAALAPLWLLVAILQPRPGRAYLVALCAALPLVAPIAFLGILELLGIAMMAFLEVLFWLLNSIQW